MTGSVSDFAYLGLYLPAEHGLLAVVLWGEHQHQIRHSSPTSVGLDLWVDLLLLCCLSLVGEIHQMILLFIGPSLHIIDDT